MSRNTLHLRRLLSVLGALLLLALVTVCGIRVVPFVRAELTRLQLPTSNVAPPACAQETARTSPPALHDSLFAAVSSVVWASNGGFLQRGVPIIDVKDALCIVRTSDGALVGHYALAYAPADLAQADGVLYSVQQQAEGAKVVQVVQVCAMQAQDGSRLWCQTSAPTVLPLVLSAGILYVQGDTTLTALRASDGAILWTHGIHRGPSGQTRFGAIAVVPESDSVYIPTSATQVCALRASDGTTRWCTSPSTLPDAFTAISSVAADTTGVYLLDQSSNTDSPTRVVALHVANGALLWQRRLPRIATLTPSFQAANGLLYLSTYHFPYDVVPFQEVLTALRTTDGTTRWETTTGHSVVATVQGDALYLADSSSVQALQASTGTRLWKQGFRSADNPSARLLVSGSMLFVRDDVQNLYAFNTSTGQRLWERIQCVDDSDFIAAEPHTKNGTVVWCTWGTDRLKNGLTAPTALAAGA